MLGGGRCGVHVVKFPGQASQPGSLASFCLSAPHLSAYLLLTYILLVLELALSGLSWWPSG